MNLRNLPDDIIRLIIPYTYETQDKSLLQDIRHYVESRQKTLENYKKEFPEQNDAEDWFINNIFLYSNLEQASMHGYVDNFYNIFHRNPNLKTRTQVLDYVRRLEEKPVESQINIFWALLTCVERDFIFRGFHLFHL